MPRAGRGTRGRLTTGVDGGRQQRHQRRPAGRPAVVVVEREECFAVVIPMGDVGCACPAGPGMVHSQCLLACSHAFFLPSSCESKSVLRGRRPMSIVVPVRHHYHHVTWQCVPTSGAPPDRWPCTSWRRCRQVHVPFTPQPKRLMPLARQTVGLARCSPSYIRRGSHGRRRVAFFFPQRADQAKAHISGGQEIEPTARPKSHSRSLRVPHKSRAQPLASTAGRLSWMENVETSIGWAQFSPCLCSGSTPGQRRVM
jgi:hypothetical protein